MLIITHVHTLGPLGPTAPAGPTEPAGPCQLEKKNRTHQLGPNPYLDDPQVWSHREVHEANSINILTGSPRFPCFPAGPTEP